MNISHGYAVAYGSHLIDNWTRVKEGTLARA